MQVGLPERVRFGAFEFDLRGGELRKGARKILLQEQPFQVLRMLVERRGDVVTREEIKKGLWPNDTVVEFDHSIQTAISKLRQALGDSADHPRYIETVARRGYRLLPKIESSGDSSSDGFPAGGGASASLAQAPASRTDGASARNLIGKKVSHYRVLEVVGGGGMGVIYKAADLKLGRRVALKFLPEELVNDTAAMGRFEREAHAASALNHPNICTIYAVEEHEGQPFIAMELLEGQTLRQRIESSGAGQSAFSRRELLDIASQIVAALEAAHQKGIIHRDIKPANIFITSKGVVKILDFGLAKLLEASEEEETVAKEQDQAARPASGGPNQVGLTLTRTGAAMGTAGYMSPEQVRGEKLDARTDIFSLGLVLYEMATGQRAFTGETTAIVHDAILNESPVPVRELNSSLPAKLVTTIGKALQKDRGQRYQTAAELGSDLQSVKSEAASGFATMLRGSRRRFWLWQTASLLLLAGLAVVPLIWRRMEPPPKPVERQITANPPENWVTGGAISPDGRYVAYHDETGLYVRSIETGETHPITVPAELKKRIFWLSWVPRGDKLLADVSEPEGWDIWEISVLGQSDPKLLFRHGWSPAVSPDGRTVAFANSDIGRPSGEIWIGGADGSDPKRVADAEQDHEVASPVWSPDGHWLAYINFKNIGQSEVDSGPATILVRPTVAGPARVLLADSDLPKQYRLSPQANRGLTWCSDGRLVFQVAGPIDNPDVLSDRMNEEMSLWQVRVDSTSGRFIGKPSQLTTDSDFVPENPTCAADGKRLSVIKWRQWTGLNVAQLYSNGIKLTSPRRLTLDDRESPIGAWTWTPDGKAVLFESARNGKSQVFQQRIDSDSAEVVASGSGEIDKVATTLNNAEILYRESDNISGVDEESSKFFWLMRKPEAGGPPEKLLKVTSKDSFQCASKLNSSPACVLAEATEEHIAFYALDPLRGKGIPIAQVLRVPPLVSDGWSLSSDGSHLAVLNLDKQSPAILVISVADGSLKKLPLDPSIGKPQWVSWTADGMGFFLTCRLPGLINLVHVTSVGKMHTLLSADRRQWIFAPLPSPDGKYLAFESLTFDGNVWIIQ